jgi:hypothetical protein
MLENLAGVGPVLGTWEGELYRYRDGGFTPWFQLTKTGIKSVTPWRDGLVLALHNGEIFIYAPNVVGGPCPEPAAALSGTGNAALRGLRAVGPDRDRLFISDALQPLGDIPSQVLWLDPP